ncbi:ABC transporter [Immersiella caudata]|uniref:ABC transporter n=1 Tax=Immersiella caudata TaxID=314043 RepID=A0AA39WK67_9PEZI|nr:ABC transporter [Immersiella caudata]
MFTLDNIPPLDEALDAMKAREAMQRAWDMRKKPEGRFSLLLALSRCLWRPNLYIVVPRFIGSILRCSQPLLIRWAISFVSKDLPALENRNEAFRLILFTFFIYTGMTVCNAMGKRLQSRLDTLIEMATIGLIHNRCLTIKDGIFDESAAVTLMSNDVPSMASAAELVHDVWTNCLELTIGMYLLADELGWACIAPVVVVLITSQGSKAITGNLADRHRASRVATQVRISTTKSILDSMKNIKMMGLVDKMEAKIQAARDYEVTQYISVFRLQLAFIASFLALYLFSPSITLVSYAIQAQLRGKKAIDVNMAFTSLAIIDLVSSPVSMLVDILPQVASILAALDRIQTYLLSPDREDKREFLDTRYTNGGGALSGVDDRLAINMDHVTVRPASTADPVLKDISTALKRGHLVVVSGAVGTGKTTLARALLGDVPPDAGVIQTAYGSIAYCSQTAWLINGTIQEAIRGPPGDETTFDKEWYKRVVHACDLEEDLGQMPEGDQTVIGSRGITLSGGQKQRVALARAVYARRNLIILDDVLSALDATTERHIVDNLIGPYGLFKGLGTTVLLITHATQHLALADHIIILDENGGIAEQGSWDELRADLTRKTGDLTLYSYYFGAIGPVRLSVLLLSVSSYATFLALIPYWLRWMAESGGERVWYYSGIYFALSVGAFMSVMTTVTNIFLFIGPHAGTELHNRLLRTVMNAPQSYFASTDTGTTLNRFSSDMMMIDRALPGALFQVSQNLFRMISQCVLLGVTQPLILLTLPFTILVLYVVQKVYLPTSRQLRFLDLEARALVNASFLETLEGVPTIRAFCWQRPFIKDNVKKLDLSVRPDYLLMCIQRWLDVVLDLMVPGLAISTLVIAITLKGSTTGGQIGIALNVMLQLNGYLFRLVDSWTRLETSLGAISRLRAFQKDVKPEEKLGATVLDPPPSWPAQGAVELSHLSVSYKPPTTVLKDVNYSILPGTKVGVVGRTGSGKSSLLLSVLRLVELDGDQSTVLIDGLDVRNLRRNAIRSRVITVPQDPMLVMTDTVRQNLDVTGTGEVSDEDMIRALERVRLWSVIQARGTTTNAAEREARDLDAAMGLVVPSSSSSTTNANTTPNNETAPPGEEDKKPLLSSSASGTSSPLPADSLSAKMKSLPLSQGQQQLFSLARALLMRPSRGHLVLLDEATSNVDGETDQLMQALIREEFSEHTVITVAHRLETILDSDVVMILDGGRLVEAGKPGELAEKEGGAFRALVRGEKRA